MAHRTLVGQERLQKAQDQSGFSNEAMGHRLRISERTWRRWKETGEVPTSQIPAIAVVLKLAITDLIPILESDEGYSAEERAIIQEFKDSFEDLTKRLDALRRQE
jgi:hypothetical protein